MKKSKENILKNKIIKKKIDFNVFSKKNTVDIYDEIIIENCIFEEDFIGANFFRKAFTIKNSIFKKEFSIFGAIFYKKIIIENCFFYGNSILGGGIYFLNEATFKNNIFNSFLDINDAEFKECLIFKNNILKNGSNLLGNLDKPYKVNFNKKTTIENNIGNLEMNVLTE